MADIAITSVFGTGGNPPTSVIVDGTSSGCERIFVFVECGSSQTGAVAISGSGGAWHAQVAVQDCQCGKPILVRAQCDETASGTIDAEDVVNTMLACAGDCPQLHVSATVGECTLDRLRPVQYSITFSPPLPIGTSAQLSWAYGGPNSSNMTLSTQTINVVGVPLASVTHQTFLAPRPQPYSSTVSAALQIPGIASVCFTTQPVDVIVPGCLPCPSDQGPVTLSVDLPRGPQWCAPVTGPVPTFTATVNWPSGVSNPPVPSWYSWTVTRMGGASATQGGPAASVSASAGWTGPGAIGSPGPLNLSLPGIYSVAVSAVFPPDAGLPTSENGTPLCNVTGSASFELEACEGTAPCPSLTGIEVQSECFDPDKPGGATVNFTAMVNDPQSIGGVFMWDFGDGNQMTTTSPSVSHGYAGTGQFTVTVTMSPAAACQQSGPGSASIVVSIARCRRDEEEEDDDASWSCGGLRLLAMVLLAAATALLVIATCVAAASPQFATALSVIAAALGAVGLVLLAAWRLLCSQQCRWWLLLLAQVSIAAGWVVIYFGFCCPWVWVVGVTMMLGGLSLLLSWQAECHVRRCRVWKELAFALGLFVAPALIVLLLVPLLAACTNLAALVVLNALSVAVAARAATCR